jgi:hypothetical protein
MTQYQLVYQLFPRSFGITDEIRAVVSCFEKNYEKIKSPDKNLSSDGVLKVLAEDLKLLNFRVEGSKASIDKIKVPVLFSINNKIDKFFDADAVSQDGKIVIEVEAGRGYRNNQFLKDIFQACMMPNVEYLVIAVRNHYYNSDDFKSIFQFLETLYISGRLQLPLKGIVLIGY